ncbi:MAG: copper transporter [Bifidobacteriaceae bacterium]|jgi:hypothetical protein|nr:copper transporter [Bifidobacteriaceae bacterium]
MDQGDLDLMINFRYHVVSLVAVFLALAVGIVLGAGPLKEPIGSSLADQVSSLRADKDALRADLEAAAGQGAYADRALLDLQGAALDGMLTGRRVAVVSVGAGLDDRLEALRSGIAAAGAKLAGQIRLEDALAEESGERRSALAEELALILGRSAGEEMGDRAMIALGLATALRGDPAPPSVGGDGEGGSSPGTGEASQEPEGGTSQPPDGESSQTPGTESSQTAEGESSAMPDGESSQEPPSGASETPGDQTPGGEPSRSSTPAPVGPVLPLPSQARLWEALTDSELLSGTLDGPADAVILLAGPYLTEPAAIAAAEGEQTPARGEACIRVASAVVGQGLALAVAGPDQSADDLVRRVIESSTLSESLSTVAAPLPGAESITALWALAAELHHVHGAYGIDAAEAALPDRLPAPVEEPKETNGGARNPDDKDGGAGEDGGGNAGSSPDAGVSPDAGETGGGS